MNVRFISRIKRKLMSPQLAHDSPTGNLSEEEHVSAYALLQALADDQNFPQNLCRNHIDFRCAEIPGYLNEYRRGVAIIEKLSSRRHNKKFHELELPERGRLLRGVLRRYSHPLSEKSWRRRLKLTSENIHILFGWREDRRFRKFVVRDLLELYFASEFGWGLVGYREFPGYARQERELCEVIGISEQGDRLILELSDATYEKLKPSAIEKDEQHEIAVRTKSGRQRATFSRSAYYVFCQYLDEGDNGFELVVGNRRDPLPVEIDE